MSYPESETAERWVLCESFGDVAAAHFAQSVLASANIVAVIPDEQLAGMVWQLGGALGGVRLCVREVDLEAAKAVLAAAEHSSTPAEEEADGNEEEENRGEADPLAERAYRTAVVSTLFVFVLPYAIWLSIAALRATGKLSARGRGRARRALLITAVWSAFVMAVVMMIVRSFGAVEPPSSGY